MSPGLPEELKQMVEAADCAFTRGDSARAELLLVQLIRYSKIRYQDCSAVTGLVMIAAAQLYQRLEKPEETAMLLEQVRTIIWIYKHPGRITV